MTDKSNKEIENDQEVEPVKEKTYVPGRKSSQRLRPRVIGGSQPKRQRRGRGAEGGSAAKKTKETKEADEEVDRYFAKLRPDELTVKGSRTPE